MTELIPFRGIRFDPEEAGNVGNLLAPPYDVIDSAQLRTLFDRSPCNIARVIRADASDAYSGAASLAGEWRASGVLREDAAPAVYIYEQTFWLTGREHRRTGIVGLIGLDESGVKVMPHERTLSGPQADRLKLLTATKMTFGQIFALYQDRDRMSERICDLTKTTEPLFAENDPDGMGHRLWAVTNPQHIGELRELLSAKRLLIADGHHRYATALDFMKNHPELPGARWRMATLVNTENPGLLVFPVHRVVRNVTGYDRNKLVMDLQEDFEMETLGAGQSGRRKMVESMHRDHQAGRHAFGVFNGDGLYRVAVLRDDGRGKNAAASPLDRLDVSILHALILEKHLGIDMGQLNAGTYLDYVPDLENDPVEPAARVESGAGQAAFFVNSTRVSEVQAVAEAGERMPQKTTYFYPKVYTGFVMHDLTASVDH